MQLYWSLLHFSLSKPSTERGAHPPQRDSSNLESLKKWQNQEFRAVLAAPAEVQLHKAGLVTVLVELMSLKGQPVPDKATLWTSAGWWKETDRSTAVDIALKNGQGRATLWLGEETAATQEPCLIYATPSVQPRGADWFLGGVEVKLRGQESISIGAEPEALLVVGRNITKQEWDKLSSSFTPNLLVNGDSKAKLSVVIKDQYGEPLSDVPCVLRGYVPGYAGEQTLRVDVARTDAQGRAFFNIPTPVRKGLGEFQVITDRIASSQWVVLYRGRPSP